MSAFFIPIEQYRTKFYQTSNQFKRFNELTEDELVTIVKKVYKRQEIMEEGLPTYQLGNNTKLERYQRTLLYLTNPTIHLYLKTFDERIAFLIMMVDPELTTFKEFIKINLQSIEEIAALDSTKERNRLFDERNEAISKYEDTVRSKLGFFDAKLIKYEELFFKRFYNERELITQIGIHNEDTLLMLSVFLDSFKSISDQRYQELVEKAQLWLSLVPEQYKTKIATYSATNQKKLIGLNSLAEQFAFYILIVDPDLDMLRIFEEESMMPKVKERIIEQFGYYNKTLLTLERKYHDRFCPNKKISIWSENK